MLIAEIKQKPNYQVDLSAMMAVCETNYWRLHKLLPSAFSELQEGDFFDYAIPTFENSNERVLRLSVAETCPYTTTVEFYEPNSSAQLQSQSWNLSPRLAIRIYHDAKMAEVISFYNKRHYEGRYGYPNKQMHHQDEKAQLNLLLAEWLNHCLHHGHRVDHSILEKVTG